MKPIPLALCGMLAAALPLVAWARPISYPGGWHAMVARDPMTDMADVEYTINHKWAVGGRTVHFREEGSSLHAVTATRGWRWNYPDSQANVYAWGGAGTNVVDDALRPAALAGWSADWEDRRWLVKFKQEGQVAPQGNNFLWNTARVGVAPYVGESGDLHTWFMLQTEHTPGSRKTWSVTPLVRQFWGDNLWEFGISSRGGVLVNFMKTF